MNKKEIAEIRKQLNPTRQTITRICGCYVSAEKEKITTFSQSFGLLEEEEIFKYLDIFKKSLSGTLGKNLLNMDFTAESEEEGGTGYYISYGKLEPITWTKPNATDPIKCFDSKGNEIQVNAGKSYICVVDEDYMDKTTMKE